MQLTNLLVLPTLLAATVSAAGNAIVLNRCPQSVYLTITRQNQMSTTREIASGQTYSEPISAQGNSFGLTRNKDYFSPNTPKLIWGFSDTPPTLYYSLSSVDGSPFTGTEKFRLRTSDPNKCGPIETYDAGVKTCSDSNDFTLVACAL